MLSFGPCQIAGHQDHSGCFDGDIGSGVNRQTNVRLSQCGGIIDAITF
jgi:hypothetical protein